MKIQNAGKAYAFPCCFVRSEEAISDYSTVFILFSCNEWTEYASMRVIDVSTDIDLLYKVIKREIQQGNMDYQGLTKKEGVRFFNADVIKNEVNMGLLTYGTIMSFENIAWKTPLIQQLEGLK